MNQKMMVVLKTFFTVALIVSASGAMAETPVIKSQKQKQQEYEKSQVEFEKKLTDNLKNRYRPATEVELGEFGKTTLKPERYDLKTREIVLKSSRWHGYEIPGGERYFDYGAGTYRTTPRQTVKTGYYQLRLKSDGHGGFTGRLVDGHGNLVEDFGHVDAKVFEK